MKMMEYVAYPPAAGDDAVRRNFFLSSSFEKFCWRVVSAHF